MAKNKPLKLEHIPLHCPICKVRFMNLFGQPLPNHSQIRCVTQKGDEMDIGVCANCMANGVSLEMVNAILEGIKDYWAIEIDTDKNLKAKERAERKAVQRQHRLVEVGEISQTGKEAERKARKQGKLQ